MRESCENCFYYRLLSYSDDSIKCCHYCLFEGKMRGCPAENCDKKLIVDDKTERAMLKNYGRNQLYNIARSRKKGGADNA